MKDNGVENMSMAKEFYDDYGVMQLSGKLLPGRLWEEFGILACYCGDDVESHASFLLRNNYGEKYILKRRKISGHRGLEIEAEQMKRLHTHFPSEYEIPKYWTEGEYEYLLRHYQEGMNLEEYVERHPLHTEEEMIKIALQILKAVGQIHKLFPPVIHRDIKPQNLILDSAGKIHLIDFETSRNYESSKKRDTAFFGTEITAAPEQYGYAQTDKRTDIYAIGKVMEFLFTGNYEETYRGRDRRGRKIEKIIKKACAFDPQNRYDDTDSMEKRLRRLLGQEKMIIRTAAFVGIGVAELCIALLEIGMGIHLVKQRYENHDENATQVESGVVGVISELIRLD